MQVSQLTLAELNANAPFGGAQLVPGQFRIPLTDGQANYYEFSGGDPDSLVTADDQGQHYLLREVVGAGDCRFTPIEPRKPQPHLRVHEIVSPAGLAIGTLITRIVFPGEAPRNFIDKVSRVATGVVGWLINEQPTPELQVRVRANPVWHQA